MGGNAFKDEPTRRIAREEIPSTLDWIAPRVGCSASYLTGQLLGSAGKREISGDLDIAIPGIVDLPSFAELLTTALGSDHVWIREGNNQIFTSVPIGGDPLNGRVQIDWMFGDVDWMRFSYHAPGNESVYKGLFRTELIKAMVTARGIDYQFDTKGELVGRAGPTFFHDRGIEWRCRYKPWRRDGQSRRKDFIVVTKKEYEDHFGIEMGDIPSNTQNVSEVIELILGSSEPVESFNSYETTWALCEQHGLDLSLLSRLFLERLNSLRVDIPPELEQRHRALLS